MSSTQLPLRVLITIAAAAAIAAQGPANRSIKSVQAEEVVLSYTSTHGFLNPHLTTQCAIEYKKLKPRVIRLTGNNLQVAWRPGQITVTNSSSSASSVGTKPPRKQAREVWKPGYDGSLPKTLNHEFALALLGQMTVSEIAKKLTPVLTHGSSKVYRDGSVTFTLRPSDLYPFTSIDQETSGSAGKVSKRLGVSRWMKIQDRYVAAEFYLLSFDKDGYPRTEIRYQLKGLGNLF